MIKTEFYLISKYLLMLTLTLAALAIIFIIISYKPDPA
jgi:hypothetical protein